MRESNTVKSESGHIVIVPDQALSEILGPETFAVIAFNDISITHMHA